MLAVRLTLCWFFTIFLRRELSLYLRVELKNSHLRMARQSNSGHSEPFANDGDETGGFHLVLIGHEGGRVGAEDIVAEMNDGAAAEIGANHVVAIQGEERDWGVDDNGLAVAGGHRDFRVGQLEGHLVARITCLTRGHDPLPLAGLHLGPVEIMRVQKGAGNDARDGLQNLGGGAIPHNPDRHGQEHDQGDRAEGGEGFCDTSRTHLSFSVD